MATGVRRNCYVRRKGGETRIQDRGDPNEVSLEDLAAVAQALDRWEKNQASRAKRAKPPEPRNFHRQPQPPVRESLGELLARADAPPPPPLDCSGWESQIYDGDREGVLALE